MSSSSSGLLALSLLLLTIDGCSAYVQHFVPQCSGDYFAVQQSVYDKGRPYCMKLYNYNLTFLYAATKCLAEGGVLPRIDKDDSIMIGSLLGGLLDAESPV